MRRLHSVVSLLFIGFSSASLGAILVPMHEFKEVADENAKIALEEKEYQATYRKEHGDPRKKGTPPFKTYPRLYWYQGKKFFIKKMGQNDLNNSLNGPLIHQRVVSEKIAYDLYQLLGIHVPESYIVEDIGARGKKLYYIASSLEEGYESLAAYRASLHLPEGEPLQIPGLTDQFPIFLFLYDYDAIGKTMENIGMVSKKDSPKKIPIKIDPGAVSLFNRADGNPTTYPDLETSSKNFFTFPNLKKIFTSSHLSDYPKAMEKISSISEKEFRDIIFTSDIPDEIFPQEMRRIMLQVLLHRKNEFRKEKNDDFSEKKEIPPATLYPRLQDWNNWTCTSPSLGSVGYSLMFDGAAVEAEISFEAREERHRILCDSHNTNWLFFKYRGKDTAAPTAPSHNLVAGHKEFFNETRSREEESTCGWKLHISLARKEENISAAFAAVAPLLLDKKKGVDDFKIINVESWRPGSETDSLGKEMVIYTNQSHFSSIPEWREFLLQIETALEKTGVAPGPAPAVSRPLLSGKYIFVRNDCGFWKNRAVSSSLLEELKFLGTAGYNLSGLPDPFVDLHTPALRVQDRPPTAVHGLILVYKPKKDSSQLTDGQNKFFNDFYPFGIRLVHGQDSIFNLYSLAGTSRNNLLYSPYGESEMHAGMEKLRGDFVAALEYFTYLMYYLDSGLKWRSKELQTQFIKERFRFVPTLIQKVLLPCFSDTFSLVEAQQKSRKDKKESAPPIRDMQTGASSFERCLLRVDSSALIQDVLWQSFRDPATPDSFFYPLHKAAVEEILRKVNLDVQKTSG